MCEGVVRGVSQQGQGSKGNRRQGTVTPGSHSVTWEGDRGPRRAVAEGMCPSIGPMSEQQRELLPLLGVGGTAGNEVKPIFVELPFW